MKLKEVKLAIKMQEQILELANSTNTKLSFSYVNHNLKKLVEIETEKITKPLNNKRLELALVDKDGALIFNDKGGYKYDKKSFEELNEYRDQLFSIDVEFDFFQVSFNKLSEAEKGIFYITIDEVGYFVNTITEETYKALSYFITDLPELKYHEATV